MERLLFELNFRFRASHRFFHSASNSNFKSHRTNSFSDLVLFYKAQRCDSYSSQRGISDKIHTVKMAYAAYQKSHDSIQHDETVKNYPVMIMHGLLGSKNNWKFVSEKILDRTSHKVIAVDARNHGNSQHSSEFNYPILAEDVRAIMLDMRLEKINAMGHSMGGRTMMYLALKYPQLINTLIVVDISPVRSSPEFGQIWKILNAMATAKIDEIQLRLVKKNVHRHLYDHGIEDESLRHFLMSNLIDTGNNNNKWRCNLKALIENYESIANFELPQGSKYEGPVLFIGGGKSTYLCEGDHEGILKLFPKAKFEYIANAGHWVHAEEPQKLLNLVVDFLNSHESKRK